MTRIVEFLGFATVAAGGMFVAIALAPIPSGTARPGTHAEAPAATAADYSTTPIVHLPPVEIVARRGVEPPIEVARQHLQKGATRPKA